MQHDKTKHHFFNRFRAAAIAALYVGCSTWVGLQADDTQIYVNKIPSAQTPNVLFAIDTSGSMDNDVPDGTQTRMEAVKDALEGLVLETSDLKAGLERFHYRLGAPIIFPVINLDDTPDFLNDTQSISSIDSSSDDAEEAGGVVTVDDTILDMTVAESFSSDALNQITASPGSSDDDDEDGTSGFSALNSPDLDVGQVDSGVRFPGVTIPQGAIIAHAEIEFVATNAQSGDADVRVFGHDVDDSPAFSESGSNSVSSRFSGGLTNARVPWSNLFDSDFPGELHTTPNIRSVVQEIVSRGGWTSGNAMTILLEARGGQRELGTFDSGSPPILRVSYLDPGTAVVQSQVTQRRDDAEEEGGSLDWNDDEIGLMQDDDENSDHVGFIFSDVQIPSGAVAVWADIQFTSRTDESSDASDMEVYGILESDPGQFTNGNDISDRPLTDGNATFGGDGVVEWPADFSAGDEEIFSPDNDEPLLTPNIAELINEILDETSFAQGDKMGFVFKDAPGDSVTNREICSFDGVDAGDGCPEPIQFRPTLNIGYATPTASNVNQQVGLRFNNVRVPQGATIDSARIEFSVGGTTTEPGTLTIEVENNTEPVAYSNNTGEKISDRSYAGSQTWNTDVWDTIGVTKQTPELASLVSAVTSQTDWCGGGSLAFRITSTDARVLANAFDAGGSGVPTLRVNYDTSTLGPGQGCTTKQTSVSINDEDNDVEESDSNGSVDFNSGDLDIEDGLLVGLRFEDVQVPAGSTLLSTNLFLTADEFDSGNASIDIQAQRHPNAPAFSDATNNVSSRVNSSEPKVTWNESSDWQEDGIYSPGDDGVDLSPLLQDIIDGTVTAAGETWAKGNALVLTLNGLNSSDRDAEVCCGSDPPARLEIVYQEVIGNTGGDVQVTGREGILSIIDDLVPSGFTPPVDALFEAGTYFESNAVHFGRTRGAGQSYESSGPTQDNDLDSKIDGWDDSDLLVQGELSRLSHPATYTETANIVRQGNCTALDPNNPDCRTEHIDNSDAATYISPFAGAEECEKGFLVLLSDGRANHNSSRDLIEGLTGVGSCNLDIPLVDLNGDPVLTSGQFTLRDPSSAEQCGLEMVDYLFDKDYIDEPNNAADVLNNVRTFTIGFDLDISNDATNKDAVEFLKALAFVGNGGDLSDPDGVEDVQYGDGFFTADSASELKTVFEVIIGAIIQETTSFVAPGNSINSFNRLFNLDDIYYALFQPDDNVAWLGNLKKFKLCTDQPNCELGEAIDKNGDTAVNDDITNLDTFGTLKPDAVGFWSTSADSAPEIAQGGAGELIPTYTQRNVYVGTNSGSVPAPNFGDPVEDQGTSPHKINLGSDTGAEPGSGDPADFNTLKTTLRDRGNCDSGTISEQNACLNELIEWITGKKFAGDIPRDGTDEDVDRWAFGDPMHSRPLVLTFGKNDRGTSDADDDLPLSKMFVGTNDGGVRMINEGDGIEEWIFFPNSMLAMQTELKENANDTHIYGIDDTPTARIKNTDSDGIIEPGDGDFVHLYYGLRRGGRQVFAMNVTPSSTVGLDSETVLNDGTPSEFVISNGQKDKVAPELLWRIDGTANKFERLGLSWSTPRPIRIQGPSGPRTVLVFGGGYDLQQDGEDTDGNAPDGGDVYRDATTGDSMGNAIFIVDANTGERLWWASSSNDGNGDPADAVVSAMNTAIPAPVTPLDITGDGLTNRLYTVDLRGQVFRVDIALTSNPSPGESEYSSSTVGVLASLGDNSTNEDRRKFFYAPEVARVNDTLIVEEPYDLVGLISGNRSEPQGKTVQDRAYAIRDFLTENPAGGLTSSNFPKCNPQASSCPTGAITHTELKDVTEKDDFVIRNQEDGTLDASNQGVIDDLKQGHGWFFDLEGVNVDDPTATDLTGEKGFSAATVLDGKMFFTTFLPPDETADGEAACSVPETLGTSRFYAVDFFTGAPAFDRNADTSFDKIERFTSLGAGPSAEYIPVFTDSGTTGVASTGGGSLPQDPGLNETVNKTFWLEEQ